MGKFSLMMAALLGCGAVWAGAADNVAVQDAYVRLAPPNAPATGAFMVIRNNGDKDIKLTKADNRLSKVTELHTHLNEGGVMKMRPVSAIEIKAKGEAVLKPGGMHVMLIDLKGPMKEDDVVPITLSFDDGSAKTIEAKVRKAVPEPAAAHKH